MQLGRSCSTGHGLVRFHEATLSQWESEFCPAGLVSLAWAGFFELQI